MAVATELYFVAWELHNLGLSVIPSGGGETGKHPLVRWAEFQHRKPTDTELHIWQDEYRPELWGIVTGGNVAVFDCDSQDAKNLFDRTGLKPHVRTPRGGAHFYFKPPGEGVKTRAGILPGLDVRGDGGFVNIAGHNHAGDYEILTMPSPDNLYCWDRLPQEVREALIAKPTVSKPDTTVIAEGQRNSTLASFAGTMRRRGMAEDAIAAALLETNATQCHPPLAEAEVRAIAASVSRYSANGSNNVRVSIYERDNGAPGTNRDTTVTETVTPSREVVSRSEVLSQRALAWIRGTTGWWSAEELDRDLGITGTRDKDNRRQILCRFKDQGLIEQHPKINRQWRYVNKRVTALDFKIAGASGVLPVRWPMGIERLVNLFPGNTAVVAGSPNAGKTALLLNFIRLNMDQFPIFYFCSEMGPVELRNRLEQFPNMSIEDWHFEALERASDFEDVIRPDCVNVIDYLEMTDELYRVNSHLTAISHKIGSGLAIVALQKKTNAQYGRGQEFGLEKPKLYLSMDRGKLTIIKGKSWAKKNVDPHSLGVSFKITRGCQFQITKDWDWASE